jgi:hypothetical protein
MVSRSKMRLRKIEGVAGLGRHLFVSYINIILQEK